MTEASPHNDFDTNAPPRIDFDAVKDEAIRNLPSLLARFLPGGTTERGEYVVRNPRRTDNRPGSFKINLRTGKWSDFATDDKGGDPISLIAFVEGLSQFDAAILLADILDVATNKGNGSNSSSGNGSTSNAKEEGEIVLPVPADAPPALTRHFALGEPTARFEYHNADGKLLLWVYRFDPPGRKKEFWPLTVWRAPDGSLKWRWKNIPPPRPLYGLDRLASAPDAPVVVCEGEKSADAAQRIFTRSVCITSLNGAKSEKKVDWSPVAGRNVLIWPDADEPGSKYASNVAAILQAQHCEISVIDAMTLASMIPDGGKRDAIEGWDAADAIAEWADLEALRKAAYELAKPHESAATASTYDNWPGPKPLPDGLLPVAPFDEAFLPECIRPWVMDVADRMQCPRDFVGVPAIIALGSIIGRKVGIRPQRRSDWIEVANLWGCIIGRPGALKSPAMNEILKPLRRLEAEARKEHESALKTYQKEAAFFKMSKDETAKAVRKAIKNGGDASVMPDLEEPEEPKARRYITEDTSYEALGEILSDNPCGVLAFRDELVSLLKALDREENAATRGFYLTARNGTNGYSFDRIIRGPVYIEATCLSVLGSTQPGRFAEYIHRAIAGGAGDDGLIQRFGLLTWPDPIGEWKEIDRYPDSEARKAAWDTFSRLNDLDPDSIGAERDDYESIPFLHFDHAAQGVFLEWRLDIERRLRGGELSDSLESHLAKYRKLIPTLALINHLADGKTGAISEIALLRALAFAEYAETHARRAYGCTGQVETNAAKAILGRIRKGDLADGFTARELWRKKWSGLTDLNSVKAGLELLADLGWLIAREAQKSGRPGITYAINPRARR